MVRTAVEAAKPDLGVDGPITPAATDSFQSKPWESDQSPLQFVRYTAAFPHEDHERSGDDPDRVAVDNPGPAGVSSTPEQRVRRKIDPPQPYASTLGTAALSLFHNGGIAAATTGAVAWYQGRVFGPYQGSSDVIRSIWVTQDQIEEVGEEYIEFLSDNRLSISLAFVGFMSAELASGVLAKSEKTRWAAGVLQFLLFKFNAPGVAISVDATLTHAERWLYLASTAHLNPATRDWQRNEASKEYLQMWVSFLMACMAAGATLRNLGNTIKFWRVPPPQALRAPVRPALDDPAVLPTTQKPDGSFHVPVEPQHAAAAPTASASKADALQLNAPRGPYAPVPTGVPEISALSLPSVDVGARTLEMVPRAAGANPVITGGYAATPSAMEHPLDSPAYDKRSSALRSGADVASYEWPIIRFRGGGLMDARYITARIHGQDYFVLSIDAGAKTGVFLAMDVEASRVVYDQTLNEVSFVPPIGGGAPAQSVIPLSEQRGLPTYSFSTRRDDQKRALLTRVAMYERNPQFGFSERASFTHPHIIAEVVNFLSNPQRVASRLLQLQDEVTTRYNTVHRDSHALALDVLTDVELRNGFAPSNQVDLDFRLIFHGALSLEMAHNPRAFAVSGADPVLPSMIVAELLSQWPHALHPTAPYSVLTEFGEFVRGYHHRLVRITEPTQRISPGKPLYNNGGSQALAQMHPAVREVFDLLVRNKKVTTGAAQAVLSRWQSTVGRGYIPSVDEAIAEIETVLARAADRTQVGKVKSMTSGNRLSYSYEVSNLSGRRWCSLNINGERYLLYMKIEHFDVLNELVQKEQLSSSAMEQRYRKSLKTHYRSEVESKLDARGIAQGITNALKHAVRVVGESNQEVDIGIVRSFAGTRPDSQLVNVYHLEPANSPNNDWISSKRLETHDYTINDVEVSLRLQKVPHKIFERLVYNYNRDSNRNDNVLRGFTGDDELVELLRPEFPNYSNAELLTEIAKIVTNQIKLPLRHTNIGTINQVDLTDQHGYLFHNPVCEPMNIAGRMVWLEFLPQDRPLFQRLLVGKLDTRAIQNHFKDWNQLYPKRPVSLIGAVGRFLERAELVLSRGRLSEHGPRERIGWILGTKRADDKTYLYEFESTILGKSETPEPARIRIRKPTIPTGTDGVASQEAIEANIIKLYSEAAKGEIPSLDSLLSYVAQPLRRVYRTADTPAAAHVWQLVERGPPEIRERAIQGLEEILAGRQANTNTQSYILRRVPLSPHRCFRLVWLGLEHPSLEVQLAAIRSTRMVADQGRVEFLWLWNHRARALWKLNQRWETKSRKNVAVLKKILMSTETDPHVQSFIMNLAGDHVDHSYTLVAAALEHPNPKIRRRAAEITLDWVEAEDARFTALWKKRGPDELKPWFASELEKRTEETKKRQRRKDPDE